jgi:para-nitrobenzyl esterase
VEGVGLPWWKRILAEKYLAAQARPSESESCLFLNVRTGNLDGDMPVPVMVWIHGGSHQAGAGSTSIYQSNGLVEKGVVLVTINYRLGPLGYLAHPALTEADGTSGNYGLLDQIAALHWVRRNINTFGGDPNNITVFGESAGAQSVSELMASPYSVGLFDKVILESGSSSYNALHLKQSPLVNVRSAEDAGTEFLSTLVPPAAVAADLRAMRPSSRGPKRAAT